jgi:glutamate/tyrosine decarboxylase-like PLP-dependent enzyme
MIAVGNVPIDPSGGLPDREVPHRACVPGPVYFVHGFEQSRRFRALKVWTIFKRYGAAAIGRFVEANVEQARRLYDLAEADPELEGAVRPALVPQPVARCCGRLSGAPSCRSSVRRRAKVWGVVGG